MDNSAYREIFTEMVDKASQIAWFVLIGHNEERTSYMLDLIDSSKKLIRLDVVDSAESIEVACKSNDNSVDFVYVPVSPTYMELISNVMAWRNKVKAGGHFAGDGYETNADVKKLCADVFPGFKLYSTNHWLATNIR